MQVKKSAGSGCEKCGSMRTNTYQRNLPRSVQFCFGCWKKFVWARSIRSVLWEANSKEFLQGYIGGVISPYPDDAAFHRRLAIRELTRYREMRSRQKRAAELAWKAREDGISFASQFLGEPEDKLTKTIVNNDVRYGISAVEGRIQKLLDMDPVYKRFLVNVKGPGVVICGALIGEIGVARTLLCYRHENRARVFANCEHGRGENIDEALFVSHPNQRVHGIASFPSTSELHSFFGILFSDSGVKLETNALDEDEDEPWFLARSNTKGQAGYSTYRKTVIVGYLGGVLEKVPIVDLPNAPLAKEMRQEKVDKLEQWRERYANNPPAVCSPCAATGCDKCAGSGKWEKPKSESSGIWVCRCHSNGYWFGSPSHIRMHAFRKTGSRLLDSLYHAWQYIEGIGPEPCLPSTRMHLS